MQWQDGEAVCGSMLRRGPLTRSKVSPGLAKLRQRPITRSLVAVAMRMEMRRGSAFLRPTAEVLRESDSLKKVHSSMSPKKMASRLGMGGCQRKGWNAEGRRRRG